MNRVLFLLMFIIMSISGWSQDTQVTIGSGGYGSNSYTPTNLYYKNSASQTIYLQSEINSSGWITAISFKNNYTTDTTPSTRSIRVYMATTSLSEFATTSDYLPLSLSDLVFEGTWTVTYGGQWSQITLDEPFYYDNTSNLVIGIEDYTGSYPGNGRYWESSAGTNRSLYRNNDANPISITFQSASSGTPLKVNYYPNVQLTLAESLSDFCFSPRNIMLTDTTSSSATITWSNGDDAPTFYYQLKRATETVDENGYESTSDTTVSFSDLQSATAYDFIIYSDCGTSQSVTKVFSFITPCDLIDSVPRTWDFEQANNTAGTSSYPLPACWQRVGTENYPYSYSSTANAVSGTRVLYYYGKDKYGVLPQIDTDNLPINTLQLSFYAKKSSATSNDIQVGVMTDPEDTTTFTPVSTLELTTTSQYIDASLESYTGTGEYIAIRSYGSSTYGYVYIDDVTLMLAPECSRPDEMTVTPSAYEFTTTWKSTATDFAIYYKPSSDASYQMITDFTENSEDTTWSVTISDDITPNTNYDIYVNAICSDGTEIPSQVISFATTCVALDIPYITTFDSVASGSRPSCWQFINETSAGYPMVSSASYRGHNSTNGLEFRSTISESTAAIAVMPEFTTDINQLSVSFWTRPESNPANNSYSSGRLDVGYVTNPTDASTFVMLDSISVYDLEDSAYHKYRVNFDQVDLGSASMGYIAFRHVTNSTGWYWYLDDVTVEEVPSCMEPSHLDVVSLAANRVDLTWTSEEETLTLLYKEATAQDWTTVENVSLNDDSVYVLDNLLPNTTYEWKLSFVCSSDNETYTSETKSFTTECSGITTVPMTWDFESGNTAGTTSYTLPGCWKRIHTTYPYVYSSSTYAHGGTYSLYFYGDSKYAILQPIDTTELSINNLQLSFYARGNFYANNIQVGVMTDPTDTTTFVVIDTFDITTTHQFYEVSFAPYTGNGEYIAIRNHSGSSASAYIDDMTLDVLPSCSKPVNLDVTLSSNSVVVTYSSTGDDFVVYYKESTATDYQSVTDFTALEQSGNWTTTISGLTPATNYNLYVEAVCTDGNISSDTITFATRCLAIDSLPKTWDFEAADNVPDTYPMPVCWTRTGSSTTNPYSYSYSSAYSGSRVLYFYGNNGRYAVLPQVDTNAYALNTLQLSFYARKISDSYDVNIQMGVMTDPIDTSTFIPVSSVSLDTEWMRYDMSLSSFTGSGSYIAIKQYIAGSSSSTAYVDLMTLDVIPACSRPSELTVTNSADGETTVTWMSTGNDFEIYYKKSYDSVYTMTTDFVASTEANNWQITLNNLETSTNYDVFVKVICDDNTADSSNILNFATSCAAISTLPQTWDFEESGNTQGSNPLPLCWTRTGITPTTYPYSYNSTTHAVSGTKVLYFYGRNKYAVLPQVDTTSLPMNTLQLSFYAKSGSTENTIQVGVMTSPTDTNTFTLVSTIEIDDNVAYFDVPFASYTGLGEYIAIRSYGSTSAYAYLDDMTLDIIPACTRPVDIIATTTTDQANISWKSTGSNFEIYYKKCEDETYTVITNFTAGTGDNTWTTSISGLNSATNYDLYVKALCGDNTELESNILSFATSGEAISTVPQTWDFEECGNTQDSYPLPLCWTRVGVSSTSATYPYSYNATSYAVSGTKVLYFYGNNKYVLLPQIDTTELPINTLQLSFYARYGTSNANVVQVGVMTSPTDTNTFTLLHSMPLTTTQTYYELPLDSYTGVGGEYIAIRSYGSSTYGSIYLDDVMLDVIPACTRPTIMSVIPTTEEVTLTWKSSADNFEIYYKEVTDTAYEISSDYTSLNTEDSSWTATVSGLNAATKYDLFVKAICSDNSEVNSFATIFRTECVAITDFPYTEGFETFSDEDFACWSNENVSGTTSWTIKSSSSAGKVAFRSHITGAISRLISPILDITSLTTPQLSYNYEVCADGSNNDSLYVYYRTGASEEWTVLKSYGPTHSGSFNSIIIPTQFDSIILPSASSTYQIAFVASGHNGWGLYLDNVVVSDNDGVIITPVEPTVATNVATNIAQTTATLNGAITDAGNQTITAKGFEWKATNGGTYAQVLSTATGNTLTYNLTNLTANTSYTYKAFATTANGTVYGTEQVFTTLQAGDEPCTPLTATVTETLCYGETFTFNGQTYNATGTYTTTVAGQNGDCDTNYTINLTILPQNTASITETLCYGETFTFNGQTYNATGTYNTTVAGQSGDCDTLYTINLTILPQNTASITETLCYGETFTFNGQTYNATGTYTTTVAGQSGDCDTLYTINLTILPQNTPINDVVTISQRELPYSYHGQTYSDFGSYTLTTQDENGCDQVYNLTLVHNSGISEVEGGLTISLYPNPTDDNATLRVKGLSEQATIIITDQQGRVVSSKVLAQGVETLEIETANLASGVYYIRIQTANTIKTEKLIKK